MSEDYKDNIKLRGEVEYLINYKNGDTKSGIMKNTILRKGKEALAKTVTNFVNDPFNFYVDKMNFGTNGTVGGTPRYVEDNRTALFGPTSLSENVISAFDNTANNAIAVFTAVISFDEGIGLVLNEMALQMKNDDLFSMITFPDLTKTEEMQITYNWRIYFL